MKKRRQTRSGDSSVSLVKLAGSTRQRFRHAVTINRPPDEVYAFWRDFTNLPRFMRHLERVEVIDERASRWTAKSPTGGALQWSAEIVAERPGRFIEWRTTNDAPVAHSGRVLFEAAPGSRGTEVHVTAVYDVPAGAVGVALAKLAGEEPSQQVREDLRRLKQVLECGEVILSEAGPSSARSQWQQRVTQLVQKRLATGGRA